MKLHYQPALVGFLLFAALLLAACSVAPGPGDVVVEPGQTIKVGAVVGLTGPLEEPSLDILHGIEIATAEYNEAGGIQGFELELVVEDDGCAPDLGAEAAQRIAANPEIIAVVGHVCSGASLAGAEVYQEARIPMISASSTSPALTAVNMEIVNRTGWNDNIQGQSSARYVFDTLGLRKAAILHDGDAYGEALAQVFNTEFSVLGGAVVAFQAIDINQTDYRQVLSEVTTDGPEVVFFGGYDDQAILLVQQMQEIGLGDMVFFTDDGSYNREFIDGANGAAEGSYASFASPPPGIAEALNAVFDARYQETYGQLPDSLGPFHAHAHDAATIIYNAIAEVAHLQGRRLIINREELIDAIRSTRNYRGLTGTLSCDERGECGAAGTVSVVQVVNGEWVEVER
jgi:branched-chain amino acid transport system substrate-binding protein